METMETKLNMLTYKPVIIVTVSLIHKSPGEPIGASEVLKGRR